MNSKANSEQHEEDQSPIISFLHKESAGGIVLIAAATIAILLANSPLYTYYDLLLQTSISVSVGDFAIDKPLLLWVNDGLMALFFFLVGLELKREVLEGELSSLKSIVLPGVAALGGIILPAGIYVYLNHHDQTAMQGWAIPAATDIAFALGILALLGSSIPKSLKVFLTSVAIFDDIGAIVIIALFYTNHISLIALGIAVACCFLLFILNRQNITDKSPYFIIGLIMWVALLKSGVHATLSGVILAMFIPIKDVKKPDFSPLKSLEKDLHASVAFIIVPVFAFFNSGINLTGVGLEQLSHSIPLGIAIGLFIGKQVGVFGFCWCFIKMGLAQYPKGATPMQLYGVSVLTGIGFTMSLFIGSLAFEESGVDLFFDERLGILMGSLLSAVVGYLILRFARKK